MLLSTTQCTKIPFDYASIFIYKNMLEQDTQNSLREREKEREGEGGCICLVD